MGGGAHRYKAPTIPVPLVVGSLAARALGGEGRSSGSRCVRPLLAAGQPPEGETPTLLLTISQSSPAQDSRSLSCLVPKDPLHGVS